MNTSVAAAMIPEPAVERLFKSSQRARCG